MIFDINGKPIKQGYARNLTFEEHANRKNKETAVEEEEQDKQPLKTSASLQFLKEEPENNVNNSNPVMNALAININNPFSDKYWSLYEGDRKLEPLKFTNGKTQEDVVKEVVDLSKKHKVIFIHGTCGSGKSAIALNIARVLGKTSIVVPVKALQKQYEEDYISKKFLKNSNGKKMKIAMITGRDNHDSIINPGMSCADPSLPENIKIVEKNYGKIMDYVRQNPFLSHVSNLTLDNVRRFTIAASNPYWSPILPA